MCDEMVSAAAKFISTRISLQNKDNIRVVRLVGDATHDEAWQKLKLLRIGLQLVISLTVRGKLHFCQFLNVSVMMKPKTWWTYASKL